MEPKSTRRSFLAIAGSSLLAISYSHGQTLANSYLTSLDVSSPVMLLPSANFPSFMVGPLTGSSNLTISGLYTQGSTSFGTVSLTNNGTTNTFNGNIIVNSGSLRIAGALYDSNGGFTAPSMTSSNTITINRAGILTIDDNVGNGYTANRFGTGASSARPAVNLAGGTINLNGRNNASSSVQTFGVLTASSGYSQLLPTRPGTGNPTLTFDSLTISKGAVLNFYSAALGTGTNDARVTFTNAPTMINGIIAGGKYWSGGAGVGELATYDATNGVKAFTAYDLVSSDINVGTSATTNFAMTVATTPVALGADRAVNSLNYRANGGTWSLGGFKLTLTSGMFLRNGTNSAITINNGTLTAGNGADAIDLNIATAQQNVVIDAVIADNASSVVTLVKSHGNQLGISGAANNTYTGGTYVVDGQLNTGNVANRAYLSTGKVTVDGNGLLVLGQIGATSNATGDDFTATNGGRINIGNFNHGSVDTFNIGANSFIAGASGSGTGLASLTRGTNITLAAGAIVVHNTALSAALNLTTGTIQNLGTNADLFYGLTGNQNNSAGQITIGAGTAFRGISTDRQDRLWEQGTINIGSGTTSVVFQGHAALANAAHLVLGNGTTAGAPVIALASTGTVDINTIGRLQLNDDTAVYGDTSASRNVRFVATPGSILIVNQATGMGSGTGIASALIQAGGLLNITNAAALNGAVTVEAGGQFTANLAGGLTGAGALTFNEGSILSIATSGVAFTGSQATSATINPGTLVKLQVGNYGTASQTLDSILGSGANSVSYIGHGSGQAVDPAAPNTAVYTLNKSSLGKGGVLTNDSAPGTNNRNINNLANGHIALGANGGVIAATTTTDFIINENITGNASLTIGTTDIIDGAPKHGIVSLNSSANNYTGTTFVNTGTLVTGNGAIPNSSLVSLANTAGVTFRLNGAETIGNLAGGALSTVTLGAHALTLGDATNQTFAGTFSASASQLVKQGTGTLVLSGTNGITGATSINDGALQAISGTGLNASSILQLRGGVFQSSGTFSRTVGTAAGNVNWSTSSGGFAANGGTLNLQLNGGIASVTWNASSMVSTGQALIFGSSSADSRVDFQNALNLGSSSSGQRTITVNDNTGSTTDIARISGQITNTAAGWGILKNGAGTLELSHSNNTYTGATTVAAGRLLLGANDVLPNATNVTIDAATLDAATFDDSVGTLDVSAAATINLGSGANLVFADSNLVDWTLPTAGMLNITGAFVSGASIKFATSGGLSPGQLASITLNGVPTSFSLDGSGFLVSGGGPVGFAAWQAANGTLGGRDQDHDGDGVDNGTEHFIYGAVANSGFTALPSVVKALDGTLSVTWTKAVTYTGTYGTDFVVETSATLAAPWTTEIASPTLGFTVTFPSANEVKYTFPGGPGYSGKNFARLKVTGP